MSVDEVGRWPLRVGSRVLRRFVETRELTLLVVIVAIIVAMSLASPVFLSLANFRAIAIGMAPTAIIAVGSCRFGGGGGIGVPSRRASVEPAFLLRQVRIQLEFRSRRFR